MLKPFQLGWMAWSGDASTGYAHIAEKFHFHLMNDKRFHFVNAYTDPWEALICVATPARWSLSGAYGALQRRPDMVFHTMFEASPLPAGWVEVLNHAGLIWAPSQWAIDLFTDQGVTTPMFKAGYGVNPDEYQEVDRQGRTGAMKFVLWADTLFSRKNVTKTIRAFIDAGLPDADLEVKLHSFAGMNAGTMFSDRHGRPLANITLHTGMWPRSRIAKWLQSADCALYFSGGEGFGMQPIEAMSTGLAVICTNNTGMLEYLRSDNHLPVLCHSKIRDNTYSLNYGYEAMTFQPDYEQAVEQIRWAYSHRDELYAIGARGADEARRWNWKAQTELAAQAILAHYRR